MRPRKVFERLAWVNQRKDLRVFLEFAGRPVTVPPRLGFCNRAAPALDLAVGETELARLGEAVLDAVLGADVVEGVANGSGRVAPVAEREAVASRSQPRPRRETPADQTHPLGLTTASNVGTARLTKPPCCVSAPDTDGFCQHLRAFCGPTNTPSASKPCPSLLERILLGCAAREPYFISSNNEI